MEAKDLGVSPPGDGKATDDAIIEVGKGGAGDGGDKGKAGAGDGTPGKEGGTAGEGHKDGTPPEDSQKRVNDLMSKWQTTEAARQRLEIERDFYKEKSGSGGRGKDGGEDLPPYLKPGWKPESYEELAKAFQMAEERGFKRSLDHYQTAEQARTEAKTVVDNFIKTVRSADPEFDEDDFFEYVSEIGFPIESEQHLQSTYLAYTKGREGAKLVADRAKANQDKRAQDKVNKPGGGTPGGPSVKYSEVAATGSFHEAAMLALKRLSGK